MPKVFISHTHSDKDLADAINQAIDDLFGSKVVDVVYSTKMQNEGGIPHGENWFNWIVDQVTEADVAYVLLTSASVQKPWILWEAGAVEGVAMASQRRVDEKANGARKVRPLVFNLKPADIPSPFHRIQAISGDKQQDVILLLKDLITQFKGALDPDSIFDAGTRLMPVVQSYLEHVSAIMLKAPLMVSEAAVQEWLVRLDKYESRPSEIDQLHNWLKVAFGRGDEAQDRPIDLRIHRRFGELYAKSATLDSRRRAAAEFELARQLSPRDIFILRKLGNAYIATEEYDKSWRIIEEIERLDASAFERNAECAALKGKWLRKNNDPKQAVKVYTTALRHNSNSYYLANIAAEASIEAVDLESAKELYQKTLDIIEQLHEDNVWTLASAANASLALGDRTKAVKYVTRIANLNPGRDVIHSVQSGLELIHDKFSIDNEFWNNLVSILKGGDSRWQ